MRTLRPATLISLVVALAGCGKPTYVEVSEPDPPRPSSDPAADPVVEQEAVREAVREYAKALGDRDENTAANLVVDETFGLYEDLRIAALRSTREQLEAWDLLSVLMILQIRAAVSRTELEASDGHRLFESAVAAGALGDGVDDVDLDEVWIADDGSSAEVRLEGQAILWLRKTSPTDRQARGESRWRIDIPTMIQRLGPAIEASAHEQVRGDGKLWAAYTLLELGSDTSVDIAVLDGPLDLESN
jgi:hypothetical protein